MGYRVQVWDNGVRVRMVQRTHPELEPPTDEDDLKLWCDQAFSARPIQEHVGHTRIVLWANESGTVCIAFDDGDERILYPSEIGPVMSVN